MTTSSEFQALGTGGADAGCDAVFEVLDRYVEAWLLGIAGDPRWADVAVHLLQCAACGEDAEGLIRVCLDLRLGRDR